MTSRPLTGTDWVAKGCALVSNLDHTANGAPIDGQDRWSARRVGRDDSAFPARLKLVKDSPECLYCIGNLGDYQAVVTLVGARAARPQGIAKATEIAAGLAELGVLVVSGGAMGIDSAAHRGALASGSTVAVLGSGLAVLYPEASRPLYAEIVAGAGALISPFPDQAPPRPGQFVRRNRIMAGLADAVVVIDAGNNSGALHTARAAVEYGRVVAALPGSPGCDALLRQGAAQVASAGEVIDAIAGLRVVPSVELSEPGRATAQVLALLGAVPRDRDYIADHSGLSMRDVTRVLSDLELDGLVLLVPGQSYVRSVIADELMAK
jgi:DNA processing protein